MSLALPLFAVAPVTAAAQVLAQEPADGGGQGEDFGKSSPVGLFVLILFLIAVVFLVRSMSKHLKRLPESFDPPSEEAAATPAPGDAASAAESRQEKTDHGS